MAIKTTAKQVDLSLGSTRQRPPVTSSIRWHWLEPDWDDREVQKIVQCAFDNGYKIPQWMYPPLPSYNGASGEQRVRGWQYSRAARWMKLIPQPTMCSICGKTGRLQYHNENYFRPLQVKPVCHGCHRTLHRRFKQPAPWLILVSRFGYKGAWFVDLKMVEMTTEEAMAAADAA